MAQVAVAMSSNLAQEEFLMIFVAKHLKFMPSK